MSSFPLTATALAVLTTASVALSACAGPSASHHVATPPAHVTASRTAPPTTPAATAPAPTSSSRDLAATATGGSVAVYDHPGGHLLERLANPIPAGAPLTFLVVTDQGQWLKVDLAQRPNGSTGWVKASSVSLHRLLYRLRVSTETNTMTLLRGSTVVRTFPVATGTGGTPTPHGSFYITELLVPVNRGYGPYAFGLSAFSTALSSFGGGPGQIGIHGTDDAASIGKSASHGCIRLHNADITTLAKTLPLGTPVVIG
jgi:lipoprotein-anchoring transpeptidase ErfK/SrfK